jgi:hypothetical protein
MEPVREDIEVGRKSGAVGWSRVLSFHKKMLL